jgi:hypothetical protein
MYPMTSDLSDEVQRRREAQAFCDALHEAGHAMAADALNVCLTRVELCSWPAPYRGRVQQQSGCKVGYAIFSRWQDKLLTGLWVLGLDVNTKDDLNIRKTTRNFADALGLCIQTAPVTMSVLIFGRTFLCCWWNVLSLGSLLTRRP